MWFKLKKTKVSIPDEETVRRFSLRRVAEVFGVSEASISLDACFGQELKASQTSDFKANELDVLDNDIKDVADKRVLKEIAQGKLVVKTVGDYCEHMVRCSRISPIEVVRVLRMS